MTDPSHRAPAQPARLDPYDAVLLVSFGGPERPEEVVPFLENVTRGRGIPRERLAEVGEHYFLFGGRSPINDQCRMLLAALTDELSGRGLSAAAVLGQPQLRAVPGRRGAGDRGGRAPTGAGRGDQRVPVLLLLPPVPGEPVRRGRGHRGRRSTGSGTTPTTRASWPRRWTPPWPPLDRLGDGGRAAPGWSSSPTRSRPRWPSTAGPEPRTADRARTSTGTGRWPPR